MDFLQEWKVQAVCCPKEKIPIVKILAAQASIRESSNLQLLSNLYFLS
jgi:hypothetical protein